MKYLIRLILTIPALLIFGLAGVARLWQHGGTFTVGRDKALLEALRLLRDLADLQNGPPMEKYRQEWEGVMTEVYKFLKEHEQ